MLTGFSSFLFDFKNSTLARETITSYLRRAIFLSDQITILITWLTTECRNHQCMTTRVDLSFGSNNHNEFLWRRDNRARSMCALTSYNCNLREERAKGKPALTSYNRPKWSFNLSTRQQVKREQMYFTRGRGKRREKWSMKKNKRNEMDREDEDDSWTKLLMLL